MACLRASKVSTPARAAIRHSLATVYAEDPEAAAGLAIRLEDVGTRLGRFPRLGHDGKIPGTRELVVAHTSYIILYRLHGAYVEILDVRHSARNA